MTADNDWTLPVAFYFRVTVGLMEYAFKEVSGLNADLELETVHEGGVNDFEYKLPKQIKHGNLVLKRAALPITSLLVLWVKSILEGDFSSSIETKTITISLQDYNQLPLYTWICEDAYPVKWTIDSLDSEKNSILIETIEFAYTKLVRS